MLVQLLADIRAASRKFLLHFCHRHKVADSSRHHVHVQGRRVRGRDGDTVHLLKAKFSQKLLSRTTFTCLLVKEAEKIGI